MNEAMKNEDPREKREVLRREEIRHSILHAAETVISRKGYAAMTMDDVAAEARISKATLYKYVRSKSRVLFEVINHCYDDEELRLREIAGSGACAAEKLRRVIQDIIRVHEEKDFLGRTMTMDQAAFRFLHVLHSGEDDDGLDDLREEISFMKHRNMDMMRTASGIVEQGISSGEFRPVDPMETIAFIVSLLQGVVHNKFWRETIFDTGDGELSEKIFVFIHSSLRGPQNVPQGEQA